VVFVSGLNGAGKSHLFRDSARSLRDESGVRVISGDVADGRYEAVRDDEEAELVSAVGALMSGVGELPVPVVSPLARILAQAVELGVAGREVFSRLRSAEQSTDLPTLFESLVTAVAREDPDSLLVCLLDDADLLPGEWWLNLQISLAGVIARQIPLLLVVAVDPSRGTEMGEPAYSGQWVATALVARGLAEEVRLTPLDAREMSDWLGPMSPRLAGKIVDATGGHAGNCAELFADLRAEGVITDSNGLWRIAGDAEIGISYAAERVTRRLQSLLDPDPLEAERVRLILSCAALEGNAFTADAVAAALGLPRDEVIDLLDELCEGEGPSVLLRDLGGIAVRGVDGGSRHMWRYGFVRAIDWRVARMRLGDGRTDTDISARLADELIAHYGPQKRVVAHIIAALLKHAGREDEGREFAELAWLRVTAAVMVALCRLIVTTDKRGWGPHDYLSAAEILIRAGQDMYRKWTVSDSRANAQRAFDYAERAGDGGRTAAARALLMLGQCEGMAGNISRSREFLAEVVDRSRVGSQSTLGSAHLALAKLSTPGVARELATAREHLGAALAAFRQVRSEIGVGSCLMELAEISREEGDYETALGQNERSLQILSRAGQVARVGSALQFRAEIEMDRGHPDVARDLLNELISRRRDRGERYDEAACLRLLGAAERQLDQLDSARDCMALAVKVEMELGRRGVAAFALLEQSKIELEAKRHTEAKQCLAEAAGLYEAIGSPSGLEQCRLWMMVAIVDEEQAGP
jgi:tetratricopeptide (TPR) repeat protein